MPEYRQDAGVHWLVLVAIFVASVLVSMASVLHYGELLARPVLGVTLAGLLVLNRKDGIKFLVVTTLVAVTSYPLLGAPMPRAVIFPIFTAIEACLAAALTWRFCGSAH